MDAETTDQLLTAARQLASFRGEDSPERANSAAMAATLRRHRAEEVATYIAGDLVPLAISALTQLARGEVPKDRAHGMNAAARTILEAAQILGPKAADLNTRRSAGEMSIGELEREIAETRRQLEARKRADRVVADLIPTDDSPEV
jgi:hypothetical protein